MSVKDPTTSGLVGTRGARSGVRYPAQGERSWHEWLVGALWHLDLAGAGSMQVREDDANATTVRIMAGRYRIHGTVLAYAGGAVDLAAHNNDTAYVWAYNSSGSAAILFGADGSGWPGTAHLKLAEVTLSAGAITAIVDRRLDGLLQNLTAAASVADLTDSSGGTSGGNTIAAIPLPTDTPASADALRDDLAANTIPAIKNAVATLAAKVNALQAALRTAGTLTP